MGDVASSPLNGSNPLNEDPPETTAEFVEELNGTVSTFIDSVLVYEEAVREANDVNELGELVLNSVCCKE